MARRTIDEARGLPPGKNRPQALSVVLLSINTCYHRHRSHRAGGNDNPRYRTTRVENMVTSDKIHVPRGEMEGKMKGDTGKGKQESQRASKSLSNCLRWMNDDRV